MRLHAECILRMFPKPDLGRAVTSSARVRALLTKAWSSILIQHLWMASHGVYTGQADHDMRMMTLDSERRDARYWLLSRMIASGQPRAGSGIEGSIWP